MMQRLVAFGVLVIGLVQPARRCRREVVRLTRSFWVNRFDPPVEQLGVTPDGTSNGFAGLVSFVLGE